MVKKWNKQKCFKNVAIIMGSFTVGYATSQLLTPEPPSEPVYPVQAVYHSENGGYTAITLKARDGYQLSPETSDRITVPEITFHLENME